MSSVGDTTMAQSMFDLAYTLGGLQCGAEFLEEHLSTDPTEREEVEKALIIEAGEFFEEKSRMAEAVSKCTGVAKTFFDTQMERMDKLFNEMVESHFRDTLNRSFEPKIHELEEKVKELMIEVDQCVKEKKFDELSDWADEADSLKNRVTQVREFPKGQFGIDLSTEQETVIARMENELTKIIDEHAEQIELSSSEET